MQQGNLLEARKVYDRIYPLVEVFYKEPFLDMHNRMKVANMLLGRMGQANVRPPLTESFRPRSKDY